MFDIALSIPQWQGSGRPEHLPRGAAAAAEVIGRHAPLHALAPFTGAGVSGEGVNAWNAIMAQFEAAQDLLNRLAPRRLLTAGGDCGVDVVAIDHLARQYPDLFVVWFDAHLDANTPQTSPSGSFHGMPVATLFGEGPEPMRSRLGRPFDPARFFYCGERVADPAEAVFREGRGLQSLDIELLPKGAPVHIHFDADVLDPLAFPHLAFAEPDGMAIEEAIALITCIARRCDVVGFTLTEFAPADEQAAREGADILAAIVAAACKGNKS
ncbi:arginase family protein [Novosphingobium sp.]|uniref:arginase family protein n=1 Tax=Novosphingobium sp. TaxID=1874826 RepID=UPI00260FD8E3|nr:arginase family protein [Novosphingobium sp.]